MLRRVQNQLLCSQVLPLTAITSFFKYEATSTSHVHVKILRRILVFSYYGEVTKSTHSTPI